MIDEGHPRVHLGGRVVQGGPDDDVPVTVPVHVPRGGDGYPEAAIRLILTDRGPDEACLPADVDTRRLHGQDIHRTLDESGPMLDITFATGLSLNDAEGPVELQVKVYKSTEWANTKKTVEQKITLAESAVNSSVLSY